MCTSLKVVIQYYLSVLFVSVMVFQKTFGVGLGALSSCFFVVGNFGFPKKVWCGFVSSIQFHFFGFWEF